MDRHPPRPELAALRLQAGYSQESLARKIDVTVGSVRGWEAGTRTPRPMNRAPLAKTLGISMARLNGILDPEAALQLDGHPVPTWLSHYESLVLAAGRLSVV
jgi:transcriptional regulator with XRE-family HTH domain